MVRIKKKEIEQDKFITQVTSIMNWITGNTQTVLAILVGIALGIAVIFFYRSYITESNQASLDLLNQADEIYFRNANPPSETGADVKEKPKNVSNINTVELEDAISKYDELIEEYPSSNSASFALFDKGNAAFLAKKYDVAIEAYKKFLELNLKSPITDIAHENLIMVYMDKKDYDTAVKEINAALKKSKNDEIKAKLLFRLGRIYETKGDIVKALENYEKIKKEFEKTSVFNQVTSRLDTLQTTSAKAEKK